MTSLIPILILMYITSVLICFVGRSVVKGDPVFLTGKDAFIIFVPVVNVMSAIIILIKFGIVTFNYACQAIFDLIME